MFVDILFQIIINPIYILIEFLYNFFLKFCHFNQFFSITALSISVNFLWLPLYLNADKLKREDDEIRKKLKQKTDIIKKNFKGEERHMMLMAYYRENNYHPFYTLRGTFSLLLQMVFFIAAYLFFTKNITSQPDALLNFNNIKINVLPIIMTLISISAGIIYAKDDKNKKIQIWILPLLFLILLYNAPSALVLYWIFNNIFSLIKNIILSRSKIFETSFRVPLFFNKIYDFFKKQNSDKTSLTSSYFLTCICLWLLVGLLAPWNIVTSYPVKFFYIYPYATPLPILFYNLLKASGMFLFWGWVIFVFSDKNQRNKLACFSIILFYFFLINYIVIEYPYGEVTNALEFTNYIGDITLPFYYYLICAVSIIVLVILLLKKRDLIKKSLIIFIFVSLILGIFDSREIILIKKKIPIQSSNFEAVYNFSKDKKNVLILFVDKAVGNYLPLIFKEEPSLKEYFEGFTYYPNIVSFACYTRLAYPSMIGGYEYTPLNLDKNLKRSMKEKYNESLMVLPKIFQKEGFDVTVTDAPWGNFEFITPKEMFLKEGINYDNIAGKYSDLYKEKYSFSKDKSALYALNRNIMYFSFMKIAPVFLRDFIIDENRYLNLKKEEIKYTNDLLANYSTFYYLDKITKFDSKKPTFTIINNELMHNADCFLTYPNYELTFKPVVKTPYDLNRYSAVHYHSNAAGIRLLVKYLKYLKENGIYDNTRIIIVSDHGAKAIQNPYLGKKAEFNVVRFNPLLLVKDFNQKGELQISDEFMTNADTAFFAVQNIIKNPINPFTGNKITKDKPSFLVLVTRTKRFNIREKGNTPFDNKIRCLTVKDDIFKAQNWSKLKNKKINKIRKENREKNETANKNI